MTIAIRPATHDDATFLAWVRLTAARSHLAREVWDVVLDSQEGDCLHYLERLALTQTRSWSHSSRSRGARGASPRGAAQDIGTFGGASPGPSRRHYPLRAASAAQCRLRLRRILAQTSVNPGGTRLFGQRPTCPHASTAALVIKKAAVQLGAAPLQEPGSGSRA